MKILFLKSSELLDNSNVELIKHKMVQDCKVFDVRARKYEKVHLSTGHYIHMIKYNNKYRIYYPCEMKKNVKSNKQCIVYAESDTDNNFIRPELNNLRKYVVPNSVVLDDNYACHNFNVFIDKDNKLKAIGGIHGSCVETHPKAIQMDNYLFGSSVKGINCNLRKIQYIHLRNTDYTEPERLNGLYLYESETGTEWKLLLNIPIIHSFLPLSSDIRSGTHGFDTQNKIIYNPYDNYYIAYTRGNISEDIRHVYYSKSTDLINWEPFNCIKMCPSFNYKADSVYTSGVYLYPETNMYIGFPTYFKSNIGNRNKRALYGNILLMFSYDGINWVVVDEYFRRNDRIQSDFDIRYRYDIAGFMLSECKQLFNIYIHENTFQLKNSIIKYTIRRDGFTSIYSVNGSCNIKVKPIVISSFTINYKCNNNGYIKITLLNHASKILYRTVRLEGDKIDFNIEISYKLLVSNILIDIVNSHIYSIDLL
jgi:hypothetical protein